MFEKLRSRRDDGMTLPEVLITVVISGLLVTGMASATMVVLRQSDNSTGRLNNARSEQTVGIWLPSDLASAEDIDNTAGATPCGGTGQPDCPSNITLSGSNALLLTWTGSISRIEGGLPIAVPTTTTVAYRYMQTATREWEVHRIECVSVDGAVPACEETVVLHDVDGPPVGIEFFPGVTEPIWVMKVQYLKQDAADVNDALDVEPNDPTYKRIPGRRVTVTINGGGDIAATGGGVDQITLSAGGTVRKPDLSTTNLSSTPTFAATRSRCGGNFGLLADTSLSIGSNMTYVKSGIAAFVNAFAGTPVKLQVVPFSSVATTLGASPGWSRYFDMLVDSDVTALKSLVNGLSTIAYTNWEDAIFRMFRNSDGTVQQVLPSTLILFTDGMPTYNRLTMTSASAAAVRDSDDSGLPDAPTTPYNQMSWNRANRLLREYDVDLEKIVGVFVGTDVGGTSPWRQQGSGYHYENFVRGYHNLYEQGYNITNPQRGYHNDYQYAASGVTYQYASNGVQFQYATTGMTWQSRTSSSKPWTTATLTNYLQFNTKPDETDNYRAVKNGTPGGWATWSGSTSTAKTTYDRHNTAAGELDGFRVATSSPSGWVDMGTSATQKALYDLSNSAAGGGDGYQVVVTGTLKTWTTTTEAYYLLNDTNPAVDTDGFKATPNYTSPYSVWSAVTPDLFLQSNTTSDAADGWNATSVTNVAPFNAWKVVTEAQYNAGIVSGTAPSWRATKVYGSTPYSLWESVTEAEYSAPGANTTLDATDGWDATKAYSEPYTFHEASTTTNRANTAILQQLIAPGGVVAAIPPGGPYTNAAEATYYELPQWTQFAGAMTSMALAECGGTVTLQTKVGSAPAPDPFTYFNSVDKSTATTSSQFRSGTFDYDLAGGGSVDATISLLNSGNLSRYHSVGWTCKSGGADYPFTVTTGEGGWPDLHVRVSPNQAISCVQSVSAS